MKRLLSIAATTIFLFSCHNKEHSYKGHWKQLTIRDGKRAIMQPCDVDLREVDATDSTLHIVYPTEYNTQVIKSVERQTDGYIITAGSTHYQMRWIQKDSGIAAWISYATPDRPDSFVYVDSLHAHFFAQLQQPGTECN